MPLQRKEYLFTCITVYNGKKNSANKDFRT